MDNFLGNKNNGFYVDIGTADPIRFSNTFRFYKKGWSGVLIEPNPTRIEKLRLVRPRDIILNIGASMSKATIDFFIFNPPNVSTFSEKGRDINVSNGYVLEKKVQVSVLPLADIFAQTTERHNGIIDFISIDTEGYDMVVLKSNDWLLYRPRFVIIECIEGDSRDASKSEFTNFMSSVGYVEVFYNKANIIFKNNK